MNIITTLIFGLMGVACIFLGFNKNSAVYKNDKVEELEDYNRMLKITLLLGGVILIAGCTMELLKVNEALTLCVYSSFLLVVGVFYTMTRSLMKKRKK